MLSWGGEETHRGPGVGVRSGGGREVVENGPGLVGDDVELVGQGGDDRGQAGQPRPGLDVGYRGGSEGAEVAADEVFQGIGGPGGGAGRAEPGVE
jgi:hypothetical protein